jgi:hypothetical protein
MEGWVLHLTAVEGALVCNLGGNVVSSVIPGFCVPVLLAVILFTRDGRDVAF